MSKRALRAGGAAFVAGAIGLMTSSQTLAQAPGGDPGDALRAAEAALEPSGEGRQLNPRSAGLDSPPEATIALRRLAAVLPELEGAERKRAVGLLARPTDGRADQYGDGYPRGADIGIAESPHFCVYWPRDGALEDAPDLTDANANGVPDYVDSVLFVAEASYGTEVTPGPMGWAPPKPDKEGCGADPSAHADIYLKQLGTKGLFGYESPDPGQGRRRSQYGYLVIDDDFAIEEYGPYAGGPLDPLAVTVAHEYNHLLQQNYDSFQDVWMFESTATWTEEQVFPQVNDYLSYLPAFAKNPGQPMTDAKGGKGLKIYGSAVWNHWLSGPGGGFGLGSVLNAWQVSAKVRPADFAVGAYDRAIDDSGGKGFSREFVAFAAATAEWQVPSVGFPDSLFYPAVKRAGKLKRKAKFKLDHTGYRLYDFEPTGDKVALKVKAEKGIRYGIALVGRAGDAATGTVVRRTAYANKGGKLKVDMDSATQFSRITAVIVNADGRVKGFKGDDWVYSNDNVKFKVKRVRQLRR